MLASIHPLGERARHNRWWLTAAAHAVGSWAGGLAVFGAAGLVGRVLGLPAALALPAAAASLVLEARAVKGGRIPGPRRQVNEDWMNRYRGWVYGLGFGVQLGAAVFTIVTSAAVYLALALTMLAPGAALAACTAFGLGRALPVLTTGRVRGPEQLAARHARLHRLARPVQLGVATSLLALGLVVR